MWWDLCIIMKLATKENPRPLCEFCHKEFLRWWHLNWEWPQKVLAQSDHIIEGSNGESHPSERSMTNQFVELKKLGDGQVKIVKNYIESLLRFSWV